MLLLKSGKVSFTQDITVVQRYGNLHLGNYATLTSLNVAFAPIQQRAIDLEVAYVFGNEVGQSNQVGFYQVELVSGVYQWVKKDTILYRLSMKQYTLGSFTVGKGFSNPQGVQ